MFQASNGSFSKKLMKLMKSNELPSSIIDGFVQVRVQAILQDQFLRSL